MLKAAEAAIKYAKHAAGFGLRACQRRCPVITPAEGHLLERGLMCHNSPATSHIGETAGIGSANCKR